MAEQKLQKRKGGERADGEMEEKASKVFKLYKKVWNEFPESKGQETY